MWAQGLTVGVLIGSGVVAGVNTKGEKPQEEVDHSWKTILGEFKRTGERSRQSEADRP